MNNRSEGSLEIHSGMSGVSRSKASSPPSPSSSTFALPFPLALASVLAVGLIALHPLLANAVLSQFLTFGVGPPVGRVRDVAPLSVWDSGTTALQCAVWRAFESIRATITGGID